MRHSNSVAPGAVVACIAAGPIFVTSTALAMLYLQLPDPILVDVRSLMAFPLLLLGATLFGAFVAVVPVLLGSAVMRGLGDLSEVARSPMAWLTAGALCGFGLAILIGVAPDEPALAFALVLTSAICARISRGYLSWENGRRWGH